MTRNDYIKIRQLGAIGDIAFYHVLKNNFQISREIFNKVFPQYYNATLRSKNWGFLWDIYDVEFEVNILSQEKKIIKIY